VKARNYRKRGGLCDRDAGEECRRKEVKSEQQTKDKLEGHGLEHALKGRSAP
jgi:hypothetical protein